MDCFYRKLTIHPTKKIHNLLLYLHIQAATTAAATLSLYHCMGAHIHCSCFESAVETPDHYSHQQDANHASQKIHSVLVYMRCIQEDPDMNRIHLDHQSTHWS